MVEKTFDKRSPSWWKVLFWRLLLLGITSGLAVIFGVILAGFFPHNNPQQPFLSKIWQGRQINQDPELDIVDFLEVQLEGDISKQLSAQEREQLKIEVEGLQKQINSLSDRTNQLETELNIKSNNLSLEQRVDSLKRYLGSETRPNLDAKLPSSASQLQVTLPSDLLFTEANNTLAADAGAILDNIVTDLRQYQGGTIRIAAHVDATEKISRNRRLSFQRAKAIQQSLSSNLDDKYRWIIIGYGQTRPLVPNNSEVNRKLNRRIEIAIEKATR